MSDLMLDDDLADDLVRAFQRSGYTTDEIKRICESDILVEFRKVLLGHASIVVIEHIIDLDADPFVPEGWKAEEHQKGGQFNWDASKVSLYLSDAQKSGKCIEGNKLREELAGKPVLNANVLDDLLANPHLIPEEWKEKYVFFWGTIYRHLDECLCVRCLCWTDPKWRWRYVWLVRDLHHHSPAAVRALEPGA